MSGTDLGKFNDVQANSFFSGYRLALRGDNVAKPAGTTKEFDLGYAQGAAEYKKLQAEFAQVNNVKGKPRAFPPGHPKQKPDIREAFGKSARQEQIDHLMAAALGEILDESFEWDTGLESAPMWHELRDAIMQVIYTTEREFGRQEKA